MIVIIDYGEPLLSPPNYSTNANTISSIFESLGISSIIIRWNEPLPNYLSINTNTSSLVPSLIEVVLTGGPEHVYLKDSPQLPNWLFSTDVPVLGICYGMQLIAQHFKGEVKPTPHGEFSPTFIRSIKEDPVLGPL